MLSRIRDRRGQGNAALYVRVRDLLARYWNFQTQQWVGAETPACRVLLHEYQDADPDLSTYQADVTLPAGEAVREYVRASDSAYLGEDAPVQVDFTQADRDKLTGVAADLQSIFGRLDIVDALLQKNAVLDSEVLNELGLTTSARLRCYSTKAGALAENPAELLHTISYQAEYDTEGRRTKFRALLEG